ncbi:hypothetical protein [Ligilactobacillus saerimneri]|uniref:hypothetical protein n=1 Tax=Ligilactobacillus saerimneri TaxID=228229 RepID=UPI002942CB95|nr:hypothetical protein [Ligilactobacillus saerimneri]
MTSKHFFVNLSEATNQEYLSTIDDKVTTISNLGPRELAGMCPQSHAFHIAFNGNLVYCWHNNKPAVIKKRPLDFTTVRHLLGMTMIYFPQAMIVAYGEDEIYVNNSAAMALTTAPPTTSGLGYLLTNYHSIYQLKIRVADNIELQKLLYLLETNVQADMEFTQLGEQELLITPTADVVNAIAVVLAKYGYGMNDMALLGDIISRQPASVK